MTHTGEGDKSEQQSCARPVASAWAGVWLALDSFMNLARSGLSSSVVCFPPEPGRGQFWLGQAGWWYFYWSV